MATSFYLLLPQTAGEEGISASSARGRLDTLLPPCCSRLSQHHVRQASYPSGRFSGWLCCHSNSLCVASLECDCALCLVPSESPSQRRHDGLQLLGKWTVLRRRTFGSRKGEFLVLEFTSELFFCEHVVSALLSAEEGDTQSVASPLVRSNTKKTLMTRTSYHRRKSTLGPSHLLSNPSLDERNFPLLIVSPFDSNPADKEAVALAPVLTASWMLLDHPPSVAMKKTTPQGLKFCPLHRAGLAGPSLVTSTEENGEEDPLVCASKATRSKTSSDLFACPVLVQVALLRMQLLTARSNSDRGSTLRLLDLLFDMLLGVVVYHILLSGVLSLSFSPSLAFEALRSAAVSLNSFVDAMMR